MCCSRAAKQIASLQTGSLFPGGRLCGLPQILSQRQVIYRADIYAVADKEMLFHFSWTYELHHF